MKNSYIGISNIIYDTDVLTPVQKLVYVCMLKDAAFTDGWEYKGYKLRRGQLILTKKRAEGYANASTVRKTLELLEELGEIKTQRLTGRYAFGNGTLITLLYYDECVFSKEHHTETITETRKIIGTKMSQSLGQKYPNHRDENVPSTELNREDNKQPINAPLCGGANLPTESIVHPKGLTDLKHNLGTAIGASGVIDDSVLDRFSFGYKSTAY